MVCKRLISEQLLVAGSGTRSITPYLDSLAVEVTKVSKESLSTCTSMAELDRLFKCTSSTTAAVSRCSRL